MRADSLTSEDIQMSKNRETSERETVKGLPNRVETSERDLPLVVLGEMVIMPHMTVPLQVGQGKSYRAMEQAWEEDQEVLLIFVSENEIEGYKNGQPQQLPPIGVIARLEEFIKLPDGTVRIILEGLTRAAIQSSLQTEPFYRVRCLPLVDAEPIGMEVEALMETVKQQVDEFVDHLGEVPQDAVAFVHRIDKPGHLADIVTYAPAFEFEERLDILNQIDPIERLRKAYMLLARQLELLKLRQKIQQDTKEVLDQSQREYFLREQMRVIRRELGEDEDSDDPIDEMRRKIAELDAPEYVKEQAAHELKRLAQQGMNSPEAGVIRTYLDWLTTLPWAEEQLPEISIAQAQVVLDEDHYGLEKVKERLLEYLAVRKLAGNKMRSPILCFVGPPGVGKTSLGRSIARALGRQFVRTSLGGIRDEAEIRGHRRTYIGAMPGRIIQGMKTAKSRYPVYILDEVDKVGQDFRGDPTSALLEVLDPEQNNTFSDHYLEIPYDLSQVVFIATANQLDPIPGPLRDRMEIIEIGGYTEDEKLGIAQGFLMPKQREFHGLADDQVKITDAGVLKLIREYTREAGVRNLERELASLCRKIARKVATASDRRRSAELCDRRRRYHHLPGAGALLVRPGRRAGRGWGGDGRVLVAHRRRYALDRGSADARQGHSAADRPARRCDEGIGPGGDVVCALPRRSAGDRPELLRGAQHPRACAGRRGTEGWPLGRHHADHRTDIGDDWAASAARCGDDRRSHTTRQGAADWWAEGEDAGGTPRWNQNLHSTEG